LVHASGHATSGLDIGDSTLGGAAMLLAFAAESFWMLDLSKK